MVKISILRNETLSTEMLYFSIDSMGKYIMSNNFIQEEEVNETRYMEEIIKHLKVTDSVSFIGETDTIFFNNKETYKLIHYTVKDKLDNNLIASIFHPEGKVVRGYSAVLKFNQDENLCNCLKEDIIKLLIKRREHLGLHIKNSNIKMVTMDNKWNIVENNSSLAGKIKKIIGIYNYFVILISDVPCEFSDEKEKYIFGLLDHNKKVLIDFSEEEYNLLIKNKDKIFDDTINCFSPYIHLKSV